MKTLVRVGLLFVLLGMLQFVVGSIAQQTGGITGDIKRFF